MEEKQCTFYKFSILLLLLNQLRTFFGVFKFYIGILISLTLFFLDNSLFKPFFIFYSSNKNNSFSSVILLYLYGL